MTGTAQSTARPSGRPSRPGLDLTTSHPAVRGALLSATAVAAAAVAVVHRAQPLTGALLAAMVVVLGALSLIDVAQQRLPNRLTLPLAGASTAAVAVAGVVASAPLRAAGAIAVGLAFAVVLLALRFGMGDVKLALSIGTVAGWLGPSAIVATVLVASAAGAAVAAALLVIHRRRALTFGFGPFLALGSVAGMLAAVSPAA